jgi:hypothetical protein
VAGPLQRWKLLNDPKLMQAVNGWLTIFWIVMIPISIAVGWVHSVVYVSALSLWALVSGHWSAWLAARVEVEQAREAEEKLENPPEERVVEALVTETTIDRLPGSETATEVVYTRETEVRDSDADAAGTRERLRRSGAAQPRTLHER